jgi:DMSO/TMAO reductase YedYZ molybdopterin-dependent catalytic subunit
VIVFRSTLRDERTAAVLGIALGVSFSVCFATGLVSHLIQDPGSWFHWPARPAGLYRVTQGLHVVTGLATIPLLLVKLWVVFPKLFEWPPVRSIAHAIERLALLPLVGGALVLLFTGVANINLYRPWDFSFRAGHLAAAWLTMGALAVHVGAKWAATRDSLGRHQLPPRGPEPEGGLTRRGLLGTAFAGAGLVAVLTAGQTVRPLARLAVLAPRRPDIGPQGFPVNRTAASVGLEAVDRSAYRLVVDGSGVARPLSLSYDDLLAMPQRSATLPIACVEGWSTSQRWTGVPVRDLLALAGVEAPRDSVVHAIHDSQRLRTAPLSADHAGDPHTLLALFVNDEPLAPDHGFPVRLIGPNRPGVHQTKWVGRLEVLA